MRDKEYELFKNNYLQHPITFLTEENLDKLETHCRKAIHYERGIEHQVVLELLEENKETDFKDITIISNSGDFNIFRGDTYIENTAYLD